MQAQRLPARELDRALPHDYGISKADLSVLLHQAPGGQMRVGERQGNGVGATPSSSAGVRLARTRATSRS